MDEATTVSSRVAPFPLTRGISGNSGPIIRSGSSLPFFKCRYTYWQFLFLASGVASDIPLGRKLLEASIHKVLKSLIEF